MKNLEFDVHAFEDLAWWVEHDRRMALRIFKRKVYNNRKFCTCCVHGCGNPRRLMKGSKRKQLTVQERRQAEQVRADAGLIGGTAA